MSDRFEVAVIGGGVVGLAILRRLAMAGLKCVLLEKGADILSGASKGNSALLHTGFDAPAGSTELTCMQAGYEEYLAIREKLNLPLLETSALVVAWSEEERASLSGIVEKAHANGVEDVRLLSQIEMKVREPKLGAGALAAVLVPGEHVIDPWSAPLAYAQQAMAHGAIIHRKAEVTQAEHRHDHWLLQAGAQSIEARVVINAAGLFGDRVEAFARPSPFTIKPRKGQFVVFDKPAARLVRAIILPVPTERTKGVVLFRTIFGNLAIGPTAEETDEREAGTCDSTTLEKLHARAIEMVPALVNVGVNAIYAGLRPATEHKDYSLEMQAKELGARLNEDHPSLRAVREQLEAATKIATSERREQPQSREAINPVYQQLEIAYRSAMVRKDGLDARRDSLTKHLKSLDEKIVSLNKNEVELTKLSWEATLAENVYLQNAQSRDKAKLLEALDHEGLSEISVVQPASLQLKKASPKRAILLIACVLLAAGMGVMQALVRTLLQRAGQHPPQGPSNIDDIDLKPRLVAEDSPSVNFSLQAVR